MNEVQSTIKTANQGLENVFAYDNIAIVVLMLCLLFSAGLNLAQFLHRNKSEAHREELISKALNAMREALEDLKLTITILNERISH